MKKVFQIFLCLIISVLPFLGLSACGKEVNPDAEIEVLQINNENHLNLFGRTWYDEERQLMFFNYTASGFEVRFKGSTLTMVFYATNHEDDTKFPIITVFTDGEETETAPFFALNEENKTIEVKDLAENVIHTVKVQKRSESVMSQSALKSLSTDGVFIKPLQKLERKIEFFGDSVTCGYGNRGTTNESFKTVIEDGLSTYAAIAARAVNAEYNVLSVSGYAVHKNIWNNPKNIPILFFETDTANTDLWNHQSYVPNLVVINLGANDNTYILQGTTDRQQRINEFKEKYVQFIQSIRDKYMHVKILCCYGMMGESGTMATWIGEAAETAGMENLWVLELPKLNSIDGIGTDGHPSGKTHERAAIVLQQKIQEIMNW